MDWPLQPRNGGDAPAEWLTRQVHKLADLPSIDPTNTVEDLHPILAKAAYHGRRQLVEVGGADGGGAGDGTDPEILKKRSFCFEG